MESKNILNLPELERAELLKKAFEYLAILKLIEEKKEFGLDLTIYLMINSVQLESEMRLFGIEEKLENFARMTQFTDFDSMIEIFRTIPKIKASLYSYIDLIEHIKNQKEKSDYNIDIGKLISPNHSSLKYILNELIYQFVVQHPSNFEPKSRNITPQRKESIKSEENYVCQICQKKNLENELEIDHIFPFALGGSNEQYNLMSICKECNVDKGKKTKYYESEEGKLKLKRNINIFVEELPIILDFGKWLKNIGSLNKNAKILGRS